MDIIWENNGKGIKFFYIIVVFKEWWEWIVVILSKINFLKEELYMFRIFLGGWSKNKSVNGLVLIFFIIIDEGVCLK